MATNTVKLSEDNAAALVPPNNHPARVSLLPRKSIMKLPAGGILQNVGSTSSYHTHRPSNNTGGLGPATGISSGAALASSGTAGAGYERRASVMWLTGGGAGHAMQQHAQQQHVKYENSYQMAPTSVQLQFSARTAQNTATLEKIMRENFSQPVTLTYQQCMNQNLVEKVSDQIKAALKQPMEVPVDAIYQNSNHNSVNFNSATNRYKLVVNVYLLQQSNQDVELASRAVWDDKLDNWLSAEVTGRGFTAIALVFACYYE